MENVTNQLDFQIKGVLVDKILQIIFSYLPVHEQLNCRLVCHYWNTLFCECRELLQESVHLSLKFRDLYENIEQHDIVQLIKSNNAFTVKELVVDLEVFSGREGYESLESLIKLLKTYGMEQTIKELGVGMLDEKDSIDEIFQLLSVLKNVEVLTVAFTHGFHKQTDLCINLDEKWKNIQFPLIRKLNLQPIHSGSTYEWFNAPFIFLRAILKHMPNVKSITNLHGYEESFYNEYGSIIDINYIKIHENSCKILNTKDLKLPEITVDGNSDEDLTEFWKCLNQTHPKLGKLVFTYHSFTPTVVLHDYSRVTNLDLTIDWPEFGPQQTLATIMAAFPNAKTIKICIVENSIGSCFFGHNSVHLPNLTEFRFAIHGESDDVQYNCRTCVEAFTKCIANVKSFDTNIGSLDLINNLAKNVNGLEILKIKFKTAPKEDVISVWPEMPNLHTLIYDLKKITVKLQDIQKMFKTCKKLKHFHIDNEVTIQYGKNLPKNVKETKAPENIYWN